MKFENHTCQQARLSKDSRFDGLFFTAIKSTGIYCRSICPAPAPKEENVTYFETSVEAATAGYRPCLRCRPDSAPASFAWKGTDTTLERAISIIEQQGIESLTHLADRLGISDRYLRKLFSEKLGVSPKQFQLHQQLLFAKKLIHESNLSITEIALSAGFGSVRRFNEVFRQQLQLKPSDLRKGKLPANGEVLTLYLHYRPPFNIERHFNFLAKRLVKDMEWLGDRTYGRSFEQNGAIGWFEAEFLSDQPRLKLQIAVEDLRHLKLVIWQIRRVLDLDANMEVIEQQLKAAGLEKALIPGIRLPGIWSLFESGIRAILGQQVSVTAASNLVNLVVEMLGEKQSIAGRKVTLFPTPVSLVESDLQFLKMPQSRRNCLKTLAQFFVDNPNNDNPDEWLALNGIGPWTVDYAKLRGQSQSDIWLGKDLGIKKAIEQFNLQQELAKPWRSYLTFNLWNQL